MHIRVRTQPGFEKNADRVMDDLWKQFPHAAVVRSAIKTDSEIVVRVQRSENPFDSYWVQVALERVGIPVWRGVCLMAHIDLSCCPSEEEPSDVQDQTAQRCMCRVYIGQLIRMFGTPPAGVNYKIHANRHDLGTYFTVQVHFDPDIEEQREFVFKVDDSVREWDFAAKVQLNRGPTRLDTPKRPYCGQVPETCQLCKGPIEGVFIDGAVCGHSSWAYMCLRCHGLHGKGIGNGYGQQYEPFLDPETNETRWGKVAG